MKLTRRQIDFLGQVDSLQDENHGEPIHYSALAQKLDVSNGTAYHMLRVLEDKGYVSSQYQLPEVRIGRSSVVYGMSSAGRRVLDSGGVI